MGKLEEYNSKLNELRVKKKSLEVNIKTFISNIEKTSARLQSFTSGSKKIGSILGLNKPNTLVASSSNTKYAPDSVKSNGVVALRP